MSEKRVTILMGSPHRDGNTAALADRIAEGAREAGAEADVLYLHGMKILPCTACEACHKPGAEGCILDDEMDEVYANLRSADAIVFASPIYFFTMSAQLKTALDRCYALVSPTGENALEGKRVGLAFGYGAADPFDSGCANAVRTFQDACHFGNLDLVGVVHGSVSGGGLRADAAVMDAAADLGRRLAAD